MMSPSELVDIRLPWPTICRIACKAMILNITFEQACELALRAKLQETK